MVSVPSFTNLSFRVRKESELLNLHLNSVLVVSRMLAHYCWVEGSFRVGKESEILNLHLDSVLVVSRMLAYYCWVEVKEALEVHFSATSLAIR